MGGQTTGQNRPLRLPPVAARSAASPLARCRAPHRPCSADCRYITRRRTFSAFRSAANAADRLDRAALRQDDPHAEQLGSSNMRVHRSPRYRPRRGERRESGRPCNPLAGGVRARVTQQTGSGSPAPGRGARHEHDQGENPAAEAAFTLRGVSQKKSGTAILREIDLSIPARRVTALIGPSGAGKTSLLRLLNRLDDPAAGEITYRDRPVTGYPVRELRRRVGFVFQTPVLFPGTVRENLLAAWRIAGGEGGSPDERTHVAMDEAELDPALLDRPGDQLSVGQKQRATIARVLMTSPEVLLLDEPTAALDPETAERLVQTVSRLSRARGLTVVMVTHRLSEAEHGSDYSVALEDGRVLEAGATERVLRSPRNPRLRAFLGIPHGSGER
jgi:ABC-type methionine transport system ATPase subunit